MLCAISANAQTASELVTKFKGENIKSEDYMPDVKRMVEMFGQMPAGGGQGGPQMDVEGMKKALGSLKTFTVFTPSGNQTASVKTAVASLKGYANLIEYTQGDGGMGGMMGGMEAKAGADGIKRLQLPDMMKQFGGTSQAWAKVTDNKFNEVLFFTEGQQTSVIYVQGTDLTAENLMTIQMIPMMRQMQQGGGFGGGMGGF